MKTHLCVSIALCLFLLPSVVYKLIFIPVLLVAGLLPDIDVSNSYLGKRKIFKIFQIFVKHRGIIHSLTLCFFLSFGLAFFIPVLALPFFLGYSVHLLLDSLTLEGIRPLWPFKKEIVGVIRVGGRIEESIFLVFLILDVILFISFFI